MTIEQARLYIEWIHRQQQLEAEKQRHIAEFRAKYEGVIGRRIA